MAYEFEKINPYIRTAMRSVLKDGKIIKQRVIFDYELIYIERGRFLLTYDGREYLCSEGDFLLLRPGIAHSFDCRYGDLSQPHIHFDMFYNSKSKITPVSFKDASDFSDSEKELLQKDIFEEYERTPFIKFEDKETVLSLFCDAIDGFIANKTLLAKGRLTELLHYLVNENFADRFSTDDEKKYGVSAQIKDFIDSGQGVSMSLADFESQFSYSRFYLERCFKEQYGTSLIAYRNKKRMEYARELLGRESVSATAKLCGFSSVYSFSRAFKNYYGYAPTFAGINVTK